MSTDRIKKRDQEKAYFQFSSDAMGYEFLDIETGEKLSKLQFWLRFKDEPRKITLALHDALNGWIKALKSEWVVGDIAPGVRGPIRRDSLPSYNRFQKKNKN